MGKYLYVSLLFLTVFFSSGAFAWNDNRTAGARANGLGGSSATLTDIYSGQNNQAGLAYLKSPSAAIFYENRFMVKDLSYKGALVAMPVQKLGTFGLAVTNFGSKNYGENKLGLSYSKAFGDVLSAGMQFNYLSTHIGEGYGKSGTVAIEMGLQAKLLKGLYLGAHIFNPTRSKVADYNKEKAPTILKLGLRYNFSDKVFLTAETEKDILLKQVYKGGIEYQIIKNFYLRAGASSNPINNSFGFGYASKSFKLDMAANYHPTLGYSTQISMSFQLPEKAAASSQTQPLQ